MTASLYLTNAGKWPLRYKKQREVTVIQGQDSVNAMQHGQLHPALSCANRFYDTVSMK